MSDNIQSYVPDSLARTTVNQYGDRSVHIEQADNLTINYFTNQNSEAFDDEGKPLTPLSPTRYDRATGTIYLGNEQIRLPIQLVPQDNIAEADMPYINALCEVYAEKLQQSVTPDTLNALPTGLRRDLANQRKAFFSAESIQRSVREIFADGEQQFNALKEDVFEGISPEYYDESHPTGYDRLKAVLMKVTNTSLSASALTNVIGLISNLEKKGICHILVNDDVIKSWVSIDE